MKKRFAALLLSALMLLNFLIPALSSAEEDKDALYLAAVRRLESLLSSGTADTASLNELTATFNSLGGTGQSTYLGYYTLALGQIEAGNFGYILNTYLDVLSANADFSNYLAAETSLGTVEVLRAYAEGREKEAAGDNEGAMAAYQRCPEFYDVPGRLLGMSNSAYKADAYAQAQSLLFAGDFAGAYFAFYGITPYQDSEIFMTSIVAQLGYTPVDADDNPMPVANLAVVSAGETGLIIAWDAAPHASSYQVYYREAGGDWLTAGATTDTRYHLNGLNSGAAYDLKVSALIGKGSTEAVLSGALTATPTPAPTPVPTPVPTPRPTPQFQQGDIVLFGSYEQDNNAADGLEPIEWIVAELQGTKALLISRYVLDAQPYHTKGGSVLWEDASIRTWLNSDFINSAFSYDERQSMITMAVRNGKNQGWEGYGISGGNNTRDRLFLLSWQEAWQYLPDAQSRAGIPTAYALSRGLYTHQSSGEAKYWLRSPGAKRTSAAVVHYDSEINSFLTQTTHAGVRPAFWLNLFPQAEGTLPSLSEQNVAAGNTVVFGHFEQDGDLSNDSEPIQWQVLDVQGSRALLLSRDVLDVRPYHNRSAAVTWERSDLRAWLNGTFLSSSFSAAEQNLIMTMPVRNNAEQGYPGYESNGGSTVKDKVFLLCYAELVQYLPSSNSRLSRMSSATALRRGYGSTTPSWWWWLRSPGVDRSAAMMVSFVGNTGTMPVANDSVGVRPAIWVSLNAPETPAENSLPTARPLPFVQTGQIITFGHYDQDGNQDNGKEAIEWQVLRSEGTRALVISRYGLEARAYHKNYEEVAWEKSDIRSWLNGTFLRAAFTEEERSALLTMAVDNSAAQGDPAYAVRNGKDTQDQLFLLSYAEVCEYMPDMSARPAQPTMHALLNQAASDMSSSCWWWLRSPFWQATEEQIVNPYGLFSQTAVDNVTVCVRPAMWINLDSGLF